MPPKQVLDTNNEENSPSWRKQNTRQTKADLPSPVKTTGEYLHGKPLFID